MTDAHRDDERKTSMINSLLHDADRAVMGATFARQIGHIGPACELDASAERGYREALALDPGMTDPAWREGGNRDVEWLATHGLAAIPAGDPHAE